MAADLLSSSNIVLGCDKAVPSLRCGLPPCSVQTAGAPTDCITLAAGSAMDVIDPLDTLHSLYASPLCHDYRVVLSRGFFSMYLLRLTAQAIPLCCSRLFESRVCR